MTTKRAVLFPKMKYVQLPLHAQELIITTSYMTHFLTNERSSQPGMHVRGKCCHSAGQFFSALLTLRDGAGFPGKWQVYELGTKMDKLL